MSHFKDSGSKCSVDLSLLIYSAAGGHIWQHVRGLQARPREAARSETQLDKLSLQVKEITKLHGRDFNQEASLTLLRISVRSNQAVKLLIVYSPEILMWGKLSIALLLKRIQSFALTTSQLQHPLCLLSFGMHRNVENRY